MVLKSVKLTKRQLKKRNKLVEEHVQLVNHVVNYMKVNLPPGISKEDLLCIGAWGLIDAANKYNKERGTLFKTYAMTRIRGSILDELRRNHMGGQAVCRKARNIERAIQAIEKEKEGHSASDEEIANRLDIPMDKLQKLYLEVARSFLISLDDYKTYDGKEGISLLETIEDKQENSPDKLMEKKEVKEYLLGILKEMPRQEKTVLSLYYYEELTFKEISRIMKVSESRISQIHAKAIVRMRGRLKNNQNKLK